MRREEFYWHVGRVGRAAPDAPGPMSATASVSTITVAFTGAPLRTPGLTPGYSSHRWPRTVAIRLAQLPRLRRDALFPWPAPARSQRAGPGCCQAAATEVPAADWSTGFPAMRRRRPGSDRPTSRG